MIEDPIFQTTIDYIEHLCTRCNQPVRIPFFMPSYEIGGGAKYPISNRDKLVDLMRETLIERDKTIIKLHDVINDMHKKLEKLY